MRILTPPGVFAPRSDSRMLAELVAARVGLGKRVLDLCTGSGIVAVAAALAGGDVVAVDRSAVAVRTAVRNARDNGTRIDGRVGDLYGPVAGERFDLVCSNPPYLPGATPDELDPHEEALAWEGGPDGRLLLDRVIDGARARLCRGGALLLLHSSVCDVDATLERMSETGLVADVVLRHRGPLGPLLTARAAALEQRGLLAPGVREEDVVVVRGRADE